MNCVILQETRGPVQSRRDVAVSPPRDGGPHHPLRLGPPLRCLLPLLLRRRQGLRQVPPATTPYES